MKERVAAVETPDARTVRFVLKAAVAGFPDLLCQRHRGGLDRAQEVRREGRGDEGFKKAPVGAGPYKFVSFTPGVELVFEAFDGYWRKKPSVKRLVFKVIPEEATRLAALKRGEVDIAYSIRGELAEELQRTPGLTLKPVVIQAPFWLYFRRPVGPEIAVARPARAPGGAPGDRLQGHQPGADARPLADHQQHHSRTISSSSGSRRPRLRSGEGQEAAGRGRPPQRLRCRRLLLRHVVLEPRPRR